jgi:serine/threonine protein phosphatase 1
MLRKFFGGARRATARYGTLPQGRRVYAVGDVHGRLDLLDELLERIAADAGGAAHELVFLGDFVDRGPDSAGVIDRVRQLKAERPVRALMGNHEEILLDVLAGDPEVTRLFCRVGGRETALSYGIGEQEYVEFGFEELAERLGALVPAEHRAFLLSLEDQVVEDDYVFVHAGVRPGVPLEEQVPSDLRWIRNSFLSFPDPFGKTVVHGHSITEEPDFRSNRIGIDTGAYKSGRLTALGLEDDRYWIVQTGAAA